jgi:hypothetical protein
MHGKVRIFILFLLVSIVSGCAGSPVFSVEVLGTPTPFQENSDPFIAAASLQPDAPTDVSPVTAFSTLPAFTPAAGWASDFSPILYGEKYDANTFFFLLGGVQAGKWLTPDQAAALVKGTAEYDVRTSAQDMFQVLGYAPESTPIRPGEYTIGTDSTRDAFGMLGVAHGWPVRQGRVEELSPENEIYRQFILDWLKQAGISEPQLGDMHVFRVDLEEDGTDEIFVSATHLDDSQHTARAGDYSVVLMRKVAGNEAVTLPLVADIYHTQQAEIVYPRTYSLANFIDLNQDGVLEVVIDFDEWEGDGALLYTILGQRVTQVP